MSFPQRYTREKSGAGSEDPIIANLNNCLLLLLI